MTYISVFLYFGGTKSRVDPVFRVKVIIRKCRHVLQHGDEVYTTQVRSCSSLTSQAEELTMVTALNDDTEQDRRLQKGGGRNHKRRVKRVRVYLNLLSPQFWHHTLPPLNQNNTNNNNKRLSCLSRSQFFILKSSLTKGFWGRRG